MGSCRDQGGRVGAGRLQVGGHVGDNGVGARRADHAVACGGKE